MEEADIALAYNVPGKTSAIPPSNLSANALSPAPAHTSESRPGMKWNRRYVIRSYLSSALWIVPLVALLAENVVIRAAFRLRSWLEWVPWFGTTVGGAAEALNTVETLTISFIVFTFGSLLVAIQVASGQLTPRIIATALLRNNVIRWTVGLFTFTMLFAVGAGARLGEEVPQFAVTIAWVLGIASIAAFLFLIDYTARLLRPVSIVWRIAEQGVRVIQDVYPGTSGTARSNRERPVPSTATHVVEHQGTSGIILAVNLKSLVAIAQRADAVVEFVPRVGDFVAVGDALFSLHEGAGSLDQNELRAQVAFGRERTIEQDSTFAFRVIVDVAVKALSPAINDPTTAVLAIDQLHRLLRLVGSRHLHDDALYDPAGTLRLIFPTPNWEDFVKLAISEIRLYGAANFQIARRLRAMIGNLVDNLPEHRQPALLLELDLLDQTLQQLHQLPADLALARQPDSQGLGGAVA
jgi:uncharacterized membrane protein